MQSLPSIEKDRFSFCFCWLAISLSVHFCIRITTEILRGLYQTQNLPRQPQPAFGIFSNWGN